MQLKEIMRHISQIKKNKKAYYSNYYLGYSFEQEFDVIKGDETIIFTAWDNSFKRVFYFSSNLDELGKLLSEVKDIAVLDIVGKSEEPVDSVLKIAGFDRYAVFCKKQIDLEVGGRTKKDEGIYNQFYNPDLLEYVDEDDIDEMMALLNRVFDCKTYHIPTEEQLLEIIRDRKAVCHRIDGKIVAFYIYAIEGKKLYSNFSYNSVSADVLYSLERRIRELTYEKDGVRQAYAWFDMENQRALRRVVLLDTGLRDYIYVKEDANG